MRKILVGLLAIVFVGFTGFGVALWVSHAEDAGDACCKKGDTTPPLDLAKNTPKGGLHNPYNDDATTFMEARQKKYFSFGCSGCHGGGGGGGMCPPVTNDIWIYGGDDDTLFRMIAEGTDGLEKQGYKRKGGERLTPRAMPPFGAAIKTSDDLWQIIAFIRSKNPDSMELVDKPLQ